MTATAPAETTRRAPSGSGGRFRLALVAGADLRLFGWLLTLSGIVDLFWILLYPDYALKVFGRTFTGWPGWAVKLQHPVIHWVIGYGFARARRWALWTYLAYLAVAILSEIVTQVVGGWHQVRITMMSVSLLVAGYLWMRRGALRSGW